MGRGWSGGQGGGSSHFDVLPLCLPLFDPCFYFSPPFSLFLFSLFFILPSIRQTVILVLSPWCFLEVIGGVRGDRRIPWYHDLIGLSNVSVSPHDTRPCHRRRNGFYSIFLVGARYQEACQGPARIAKSPLRHLSAASASHPGLGSAICRCYLFLSFTHRNCLYFHTDLGVPFGIGMLVAVVGRPPQLPLRPPLCHRGSPFRVSGSKAEDEYTGMAPGRACRRRWPAAAILATVASACHSRFYSPCGRRRRTSYKRSQTSLPADIAANEARVADRISRRPV